METLALIPARGGSKSIPQKNVADLAGKPLISYALAAAKKAVSVNRIIVSTDDEEIAIAARTHGAEVPFMRPSALAEDSTPTIPVVTHALECLAEHEGYKPDYVLLLQPTEPFVEACQIDEAFELMISRQADSAITMIVVPRIFHSYHVRRVNDQGNLVFDHPRLHYQHPNRQSDPKLFAFGNLYWFRRELFLRKRQIEVGKRVGLEIDPLSAFDINTPSDLEIARLLITKRTAR